MSSSDIAVSARGVSKSYNIVHNERATTLGESIVSKLKNPLKRVQKETFWALKDINFDIPKGDVVGIVGRNGAGKSTLLKVLSRITAPTTGEIVVRGRVGSLLEVGTGFHPELTGRENIYLNGAILGMKSFEIERRFDEIVDFSGVEQFLDTPVKRYSSGMYVRLAFSVAAHLDPEVMIVDEVLAVGDSDFQRKCMGKMQDVGKGGKTILFVSHNMHSVKTLCKSALMLQRGQMKGFGPVDEIVDQYVNMMENDTIDLSDHEGRKGTGLLRITGAKPIQQIFESADSKEFEIQIEKFSDRARDFSLNFAIRAENVGTITYFETAWNNQMLPAQDTQTVKVSIPKLWLRPGKYQVYLYLKSGDDLIDAVEPSCQFEVSSVLPYAGTNIIPQTIYGPVLSEFTVTQI